MPRGITRDRMGSGGISARDPVTGSHGMLRWDRVALLGSRAPWASSCNISRGPLDALGWRTYALGAGEPVGSSLRMLAFSRWVNCGLGTGDIKSDLGDACASIELAAMEGTSGEGFVSGEEDDDGSVAVGDGAVGAGTVGSPAAALRASTHCGFRGGSVVGWERRGSVSGVRSPPILWYTAAAMRKSLHPLPSQLSSSNTTTTTATKPASPPPPPPPPPPPHEARKARGAVRHNGYRCDTIPYATLRPSPRSLLPPPHTAPAPATIPPPCHHPTWSQSTADSASTI